MRGPTCESCVVTLHPGLARPSGIAASVRADATLLPGVNESSPRRPSGARDQARRSRFPSPSMSSTRPAANVRPTGAVATMSPSIGQLLPSPGGVVPGTTAKDGGAAASAELPASITAAAPLGIAAALDAAGAAEGPSESVYGVYGLPPWQLSHPPRRAKAGHRAEQNAEREREVALVRDENASA